MTTLTRGRHGGTVVPLSRRHSQKAPMPSPISDLPPWVALGRHDLVAMLHGLPDSQALAWVRLVALALSAGEPRLPMALCRDSAGKGWSGLLERLVTTRRVTQAEDILVLHWVELALTEAIDRIKKGRRRRGASDADKD